MKGNWTWLTDLAAAVRILAVVLATLAAAIVGEEATDGRLADAVRSLVSSSKSSAAPLALLPRQFQSVKRVAA